jgi:hypothetical protein
MKWALRAAAVLAAIGGNALHIYLGALTVVGGWPAFVAQMRRHYELTACYRCSLSSDLFIYVAWYGWPFYLLCILTVAADSRTTQALAVLAIGALMVLDLGWYYGNNSRDWYVLLAPIGLGTVSFVVFITLMVVHSRLHKAVER